MCQRVHFPLSTCLQLHVYISLNRCVSLLVFLPAFVCFPENAAKVRIALVKGHGLVMVHSLQRRAEQTLSCMQKWLDEHYLGEMKRYTTV